MKEYTARLQKYEYTLFGLGAGERFVFKVYQNLKYLGWVHISANTIKERMGYKRTPSPESVNNWLHKQGGEQFVVDKYRLSKDKIHDRGK